MCMKCSKAHLLFSSRLSVEVTVLTVEPHAHILLLYLVYVCVCLYERLFIRNGNLRH